VLRGPEALEDEWLAENRFLEPWEHPRIGPLVSARAYADFSRTPSGTIRTAPDLGEHSVEVLADWGIAPERIESLLEAGAIFVGDGMGGPALR